VAESARGEEALWMPKCVLDQAGKKNVKIHAARLTRVKICRWVFFPAATVKDLTVKSRLDWNQKSDRSRGRNRGS
jgi:hypothetical protein